MTVSVENIPNLEPYAIQTVGWHGKQVIRTDRKAPYNAVSVLYDGPDCEKKCWDWITHNVDEAILYAPSWYVNATHDAL